MPELPEVETVRRGLDHLITGYRISEANNLHPRALKPESIAPLNALNGAKITGTNRRGKFLWLTLDRPYVLVAHLGMSGQFLIAASLLKSESNGSGAMCWAEVGTLLVISSTDNQPKVR